MTNGKFVISLDFELMWGVRDKKDKTNYGEHIKGVHNVIPRLLVIFKKYKIKATFTGIHFNLSSTDVHILLNAQSIFDDIIEGYGGDSLFHAISGSHPVASYEQTIQLNKNDIITFAVGYGSNKNHYNDTTGLLLYIEAI